MDFFGGKLAFIPQTPINFLVWVHLFSLATYSLFILSQIKNQISGFILKGNKTNGTFRWRRMSVQWKQEEPGRPECSHLPVIWEIWDFISSCSLHLFSSTRGCTVKNPYKLWKNQNPEQTSCYQPGFPESLFSTGIKKKIFFFFLILLNL